MPEKKTPKYLTRLEIKRFDAMADSMTVKQAALKLGIAAGTLHNWNMNLRKRLVRERGHLNTCLAQKQRSALLKEVLSVKKPIEQPEEESVE